ncbi:MAG: ketopantoate reductase family protein [Treponema sp.]|jgi:2-dehydropantoate 2-reductase|nr:ketopantoate reductase family protein [Treponema sp.]
METAVYGAGAMGTVLGAFLSGAGLRPDLISRNRDHVEALRKNGARITGGAALTVPVSALLPEEMEKRYDLIILLTKQLDNRASAERLIPFLAPGGTVLTLQNGIPEPGLAGVLGEDRVMGGIAVWGAGLAGPGAAELTSARESMRFGIGVPWKGPAAEVLKPRLPEIKALLERVCPVTIEENFMGLRWSKLLVNAAFSGLSALTGWTFGRVAGDRRGRELALRIIGECVAVCRAAGETIAPVRGGLRAEAFFSGPLARFAAGFVLPLAVRKHARIRSGMIADLDRGRRTEVDAINGVVCDWGLKYGAAAPVNRRVVELVHALERGERSRGPENLDLLRREVRR